MYIVQGTTPVFRIQLTDADTGDAIAGSTYTAIKVTVKQEFTVISHDLQDGGVSVQTNGSLAFAMTAEETASLHPGTCYVQVTTQDKDGYIDKSRPDAYPVEVYAMLEGGPHAQH